ncbi:hypothetical protein LTR66_016684, partial [Elasticomyces elasticus]
MPPVNTEEAELCNTIEASEAPPDLAQSSVAANGEDDGDDDDEDDDIQFTFHEGVAREQHSRSSSPGSRRGSANGDDQHAYGPNYEGEEGKKHVVNFLNEAKDQGHNVDSPDTKAMTTEEFQKNIEDPQVKGYMNHVGRSRDGWNSNQFAQGNFGPNNMFSYNSMNMYNQFQAQNHNTNTFNPTFWNQMQNMLAMQQQNPMFMAQFMGGTGMMPFNNNMQQNGFPGQYDTSRGRGRNGRGRGGRGRGSYQNERNPSFNGNANFMPQGDNRFSQQYGYGGDNDNNYQQNSHGGRGGRGGS